MVSGLMPMLKGHKALMHWLDCSDEMGRSLLIGRILETHLMPIMMEYRKYSRGFEETVRTLQMLCQDPTTRGIRCEARRRKERHD